MIGEEDFDEDGYWNYTPIVVERPPDDEPAPRVSFGDRKIVHRVFDKIK